MHNITMREIENTDYVQEAELRIPLEKLTLEWRGAQTGSTQERVADALIVIAKIRLVAFEFLEINDENADYTSFEYKGIEGDELVVRVAQVNV
jgi:hypothetical protein